MLHFSTSREAEKSFPGINSIEPTKFIELPSGILNPEPTNISGWSTGNYFMRGDIPLSGYTFGSLYIAFKALPANNKNKFFGTPGKLAKAITGSNLYLMEYETIGYGPIKYEKAIAIKLINKDENNPTPDDLFAALSK